MKRVVAIYGKTFSKDFKSLNYFQEQRPWLKGEVLLYLGEIEDMPGHGVFVRKNGTVYYGFHVQEFIPMKLPNDPEYDDFETFFELKKTYNEDGRCYHCMTIDGIEKYKKDVMK